jgi:hypothetical protein
MADLRRMTAMRRGVGMGSLDIADHSTTGTFAGFPTVAPENAPSINVIAAQNVVGSSSAIAQASGRQVRVCFPLGTRRTSGLRRGMARPSAAGRVTTCNGDPEAEFKGLRAPPSRTGRGA